MPFKCAFHLELWIALRNSISRTRSISSTSVARSTYQLNEWIDLPTQLRFDSSLQRFLITNSKFLSSQPFRNYLKVNRKVAAKNDAFSFNFVGFVSVSTIGAISIVWLWNVSSLNLRLSTGQQRPLQLDFNWKASGTRNSSVCNTLSIASRK